NVDGITKMTGMDVTFVTTAKTDEEAYDLLKGFGIPFNK
ncbi:MAG: 50S ribosomal protein L5, partial [Ignavibacteria bacterium]